VCDAPYPDGNRTLIQLAGNLPEGVAIPQDNLLDPAFSVLGERKRAYQP
jgi:hypothetical protein